MMAPWAAAYRIVLTWALTRRPGPCGQTGASLAL
jgi:hypothetical protein